MRHARARVHIHAHTGIEVQACTHTLVIHGAIEISGPSLLRGEVIRKGFKGSVERGAGVLGKVTEKPLAQT